MCYVFVLYYLLPAATKLGQGNVFTGVCDSVHRGGVSASVHAGIPHPPEQTPPERTPPLGADTPRSRQPPRGDNPPPPRSRLQHTVNERPVRILLECILVIRDVWTKQDPQGQPSVSRSQQVSHHRWIWRIHCMQVTKHASKGDPPRFETQSRRHQKFKTWVSQRGMKSFKLKKKEKPSASPALRCFPVYPQGESRIHRVPPPPSASSAV